MLANVQTRFGQITVEGDDQKELFKAMSGAFEVFDEQQCGLCGCKNIRPVTRKNKDDEEFHEYRCLGLIDVVVDGKPRKKGCGGYLYLGQNKKGGGLFPVRQLDEKGKPDRDKGKYGNHNGWTRYRGEPKDGAQPAKK